MKNYTIRKAEKSPELDADWNSGSWKDANIADISLFRPESSEHHPETELKLLYDSKGLYGCFYVKDNYIRSVGTGYQAPVCQDSCVELFLQPKPDKGYLNFEFNCGGAILTYYITDPTRTATGFKTYRILKDSELDTIKISHSMPKTVDPEITDATEWKLSFFIPFKLLSGYVGDLGVIEGSQWRANFYKCGDKTSHPHWASWNPLTATNFHLPECFGTVEFSK